MKLVFLQYIDRSGSSYLANLLSNNKQVYVFPEAGYLNSILLKNPSRKFRKGNAIQRRLEEDSESHFQMKHWPIKELFELKLNNTTYFELFLRLLKLYARKHKLNKLLWVFKFQYTPGVIKYINEAIFNGFEFYSILLFRDPRAICNSQIRVAKEYPQLVFSQNPLILIKKWNKFYREASKVYPNESKLIVKFEDLIKQSTETHISLSAFLTIERELDENENNYYSQLTAIEKQLHSQIINNPTDERVHAWETELPELLIAMFDILFFNKKSILGYAKKHGSYRFIERVKLHFTIACYRIRILLRQDIG